MRVLTAAQKVLFPAIEARQNSHEKHLDLLGFLVETSKDGQPMPIVLKLLVLASAAVRSSTPTKEG